MDFREFRCYYNFPSKASQGRTLCFPLLLCTCIEYMPIWFLLWMSSKTWGLFQGNRGKCGKYTSLMHLRLQQCRDYSTSCKENRAVISQKWSRVIMAEWNSMDS
jgi:hypothetical protein